jgi:hypothetical protein
LPSREPERAGFTTYGVYETAIKDGSILGCLVDPDDLKMLNNDLPLFCCSAKK